MEKPDYDIIIIGGSANGSQAAYAAAQAGAHVAIIEEHVTTGIPEHCSGLFSYWGLNKLNCFPPDDIILNHDIYGSKIISPSGNSFTLKKQEKHALVIDRAAFDQYLLKRATDLGVSLYQPFRAIQAHRKHNQVNLILRSQNRDLLNISAPLIISAEGIKAEIAQQLGLNGPTPKKIINAAQYYMYGLSDIDPQLVELYQTREYAPDFFAWIIPMSEDSAKIGLGTNKNAATKELEHMIKNHPIMSEKCKGADIKRKTAGRIPIAGPVKKTYTDNLILTGDAAAQTKPTTGGGIILGGIAAQLAGKIAAKAVSSQNFTNKYLKSYEKQWKKEMARNLKMMRLVRYYMNSLKDPEVDKLFYLLETKGVLSEIENHGHIDKQAKLVWKLMKTWSLYPFYMRTSGRLIKCLFSV